jgi:hypothetical protein
MCIGRIGHSVDKALVSLTLRNAAATASESCLRSSRRRLVYTRSITLLPGLALSGSCIAELGIRSGF